MKPSPSRLSRRNFLLAAGAGGVATAAAVATSTAPRTRMGKPEAANGGKGYHVTEHILKYYNTTKV